MIDRTEFKQLQEIMHNLVTRINDESFDEVEYLQKNAGDAARRIRATAKRRKWMNWSFIFPLTVGWTEAICGMLPIFSTVLSIAIANADLALHRKRDRDKWLWIFRKQIPED